MIVDYFQGLIILKIRKIEKFLILHGKNKYWEIYLTVLEFRQDKFFRRSYILFIKKLRTSSKKMKECPRLIQAQSKKEILSNFIVKFLKNF